MAVVAKSGYLSASRAPRYSLTFVLPLLLLYEFAAAALTESTQGVRNGADVMLKSLVARVGPGCAHDQRPLALPRGGLPSARARSKAAVLISMER